METYLNFYNNLDFMDFEEKLGKLKESNAYKEWNAQNPENFFSYALKIFEEKKEDPWQFGFYLKSKDKMASFIVDGETIKREQEEEVFKKPETEVRPISLENVKLGFKDILELANRFKKEKYPGETASKTIAILQNLDAYGNIWNITFITQSFNALNMKLSAESGRIVYSHIESLLNFRQNS